MVALLEQHRDLAVKQDFWHHGVITLGHGHIDELPLVASIEVSPRVVSCALSAAHQHLQVSEKINRSLQIGCGSKEVLRLVD